MKKLIEIVKKAVPTIDWQDRSHDLHNDGKVIHEYKSYGEGLFLEVALRYGDLEVTLGDYDDGLIFFHESLPAENDDEVLRNDIQNMVKKAIRKKETLA